MVAACALALAAGTAALVASTLRAGVGPGAIAAVSSGPPLVGVPRVAVEIPLADPSRDAPLGGVAVGAGSAWVGVPGRGEGGQVVRIDLATNEVVARIPVREAPYRKQIVVTDEAVWVASRGLMERIDPDTNAVCARVELPGRAVSAIAADGSAVWAITVDETGRERAGTLVRVDPATNRIAAEIPLGPQVAGYEDEIALGAGSVWVVGVRWSAQEDAEHGSDLIRVDPATNRIAARIPVGAFHAVVGPDDVWVRFPVDGAFDRAGERWLWSRVDARTAEVSPPFEFEGQGLRLVTPEGLWSVGYDEREHVRVTRFDPETLEAVARSEPIRSYFHDAVVDPISRTVWVSAVWSLVRVDIVDEVSPFPSDPSPSSSHDSAVFRTTPSRS